MLNRFRCCVPRTIVIIVILSLQERKRATPVARLQRGTRSSGSGKAASRSGSVNNNVTHRMCTHRLQAKKMTANAARHPHPIWPRHSRIRHTRCPTHVGRQP